MKSFTLVILSFLLLMTIPAIAQKKIAYTQLDKNKLPADIMYKGDIKSAVKWTDQLGEHILITTETGIFNSGNEDERNAELYAMQYHINKNTSTQSWKVTDYVKNCSVDLEASFVKNSLEITDLNQDGIAEVWLVYTTVCHGDVSPSDLKIIMVEDTKKYGMRGQTRIKLSANEYLGGEYKFDNAFKDGPASFRNFATSKWKKHMNQ